MKDPIPTAGSSLDRALEDLCPPGFGLYRYPSTVEVIQTGSGKVAGIIPVPYDPQPWAWWKEQIAAIIGGPNAR